jgi:Cytochrome c554 and c-prime
MPKICACDQGRSACLSLVILAACFLAPIRCYPLAHDLHAQSPSKSGAQDIGRIAYLNTAPSVAYVGSEACATCHASIYKQYIQTDMANSMSLPAHRPELEGLSAPVRIFDKRYDQYFEVFRQGDDFYQSEYAFNQKGTRVFTHTEKISYALGTGENGICYVVQRGRYLFQAPIAFYTKAHAWGLAPGYESHNFGFSRPIRAACAACHSGLSQPVSDMNELYKDPPFVELGIGCENCHGPGQLHVEARTKGKPAPRSVDPTIVNPGKIPAWMADGICMFCHEEGEARVLMRSRKWLDFRPGSPLGDTLSIFVVSRRGESSPRLRFLDYYSQMVLSKCFSASQG